MNEHAFYRISVKGLVIDNDGRLLLSRESNGTWDLLGGGLDHGEDPIAGLKREIFEEAGLEITYISPSPIHFIAFQRPSGTYAANVIYQIKLKNLDIVPSDECQELRFFTIEEMRQLELYSNGKKFLEHLEELNAS